MNKSTTKIQLTKKANVTADSDSRDEEIEMQEKNRHSPHSMVQIE
jgi:hypothetical protein